MRIIQRVFCSLVLMIFVCGATHSQEISEADAQYVSAQKYLENDDYKNALRSVHLARVIYEKLGNMDAVRQCDELVGKISLEITPAMKADYYYRISEDYYFDAEKNPSIDLYSKAVYFASNAKQAFADLGDAKNMQRAQDLIDSAESEINKYFSQEKLKANTYYNIARERFIDQDYLTALSYAENASFIYSQIPDAEGIERTQTLIKRINENIDDVKKNAQSTCDTAMSLYNDGNMSDAEVFASKCKALYQSVGYSVGALRANEVLTLINKFNEHTIERKKTDAARLFKEAQEALVRKMYVNATESVKEARNIYGELYDQVPSSDENLRGYYRSLISDCDRLYLQISSEWGNDRKKLQAEQFFTQAQQYYIDQYFDEALTYAERAKNLFDDIQDYVDTSKTISLIKTINERVLREQMGDDNLSSAKFFLAVADFDNSLVYANRAKGIYSTLLGSNKTLLADDLLAKINEGMKKKEGASSSFNLAYEQFNAGNYEASQRSAEQAYKTYIEINYSIGIQESKVILDKASDKVAEDNAKQRTIFLSALVVVIFVAILVLNYLRKKKEMDEAARIADEERRKRDEMEKKKWDVRKDIEAERLAEEKFKEMIAEERDLISDKKPKNDDDLKEDVL